MESIKNWFQDWSDACEYAKECAPDLSFAAPQEPFSALASIAAVCFLIWWWNERTTKQAQSVEHRAPAETEGQAVRYDELSAALDRAMSTRPAPEKKAA